MSNDINILILGAIFGLFTALMLEFARHWLSKNRQRSEEKKVGQKQEKEAITEFLTKGEVQKSLALVTVKKIPKLPLIDFKNEESTRTIYQLVRTNRFRRLFDPNEKHIAKNIQIIGRSILCDIRIRDEKVSRKHAMIRFENNNYVIYDLDSSNGTFINGKKINGSTGITLTKGDVIKIGLSEFVFDLIRSPRNQTPDNEKDLEKKLIENDSDFIDDRQ